MALWLLRSSGSKFISVLVASQQLSSVLGPVVRLGPNELSFNSIEALKTIYTGAFEKDDWYSNIFKNYGVDNLVSTLKLKPHSDQKRLLSKVYSKTFLQDSVDLQKSSSLILSERLLPLVDEAVKAEEPFNVFPVFEAVGMDFTSAYLFGTSHGTNYLHDKRNWQVWMDSYEEFKAQSSETRIGSYLERWCLSACEAVERSVVAKKAKGEQGGTTVGTEPVVFETLYQGLENNRDSRPRQLAVASEMLDHLIAGHETSGITFTYLIWQLSQHPKTQDDLRKELLTLSPTLLFPGPAFEGLMSLPSPHAIDFLPLLDAVVRETLRLHAAAPGPLPRVIPHTPDPIVIEGYTIPAGVKVSSSSHTLHRNSDVYPEPTKWLPGRWLNPKPGEIHDMRRLFWAFGSGGRMCLGSNFALQEIKLVIAAIYTNYTTTVVCDDGIEQEDAFIAPPISRKLDIQFRRVENSESQRTPD
ncbi:hypothetical protein FQN54_009227 [Arachnomyces sp. PD_36]|nr:hypothetical protein FQN54_009227 [Arachnomyces sp. PD_36]